MTDRAYKAQDWLLRTEDLEDKRKRVYNSLVFISGKVNNAVCNYESSGSRDRISSQAHREDLLLDYSEKLSEYEKLSNQVGYENVITMKVIDRLPKIIHRIILFDRYINRIKWKDMPKLKRYDVKLSQIHNYHREALDALGSILDNNPPEKLPSKRPKKATKTQEIKASA